MRAARALRAEASRRLRNEFSPFHHFRSHGYRMSQN
jgi:hypothetical protein